MTQRRMLWVGFVALLLLAVAGLYGAYGTRSISLTQAQVQERINAQLDKDFPIKGKAALLVKSVNVKSATVTLHDGQVETLVALEGTMRADKKFTLSVHAIGVPTYAHGEFFFTPRDVEVQQFNYEGGTPAEQLKRFADRYLSDAKARQLVQDAAPGVEGWITEVAQDAAVHTLSHRPVYRLKDDLKGTVIRSSLESVKIEGDRIVVTFSLLQLTLSILFGFVCVAIALVLCFALIADPTLGAAILLFS